MANKSQNTLNTSDNKKTLTADLLSSVDNLILYEAVKENKLIYQLRLESEKFNQKKDNKKRQAQPSAEKRRRLNKIISKLVEFSENRGLNGDLWHNYLKGLLLSDLNTFSLQAEKENLTPNSSLYKLAAADISIIADLFSINFTDLLELFDSEQYSYLYPYQPQKENYDNISKFNSLFKTAAKTKNYKNIAENNLLSNIADFYFKHGASILNKSSAFYWKNSSLKIINNPDPITFSEIIGYQKQKEKLIANTESFLNNKKAHNVLLYGDSGTGKSSSVKALLNKYQDKGLRLIEINNEQINELPKILDYLNQRGLYFIIFMDDLSFEEFETEYKYLKAVMEGGIELKPDNVLFYATSNRRHIVREKWQDREAEVHKNDILNEKLSLSERFGLTLMYNTPAQEEYLNIVRELAVRENIKINKKELEEQALQWSQWNNGRSGRSARQFINELLKNN